MVLEKSALFQRFQSSKNKSLVLLISTCLLLTAPASHSFFAIIFGGDIAVKIGLSIPALFGFMYSKRPGDRDRDYNIMYFDAPTISYPSDFDEDARLRTECVLDVLSRVNPNSGTGKFLENIKGKKYYIREMTDDEIARYVAAPLGATSPGSDVIKINSAKHGSSAEMAETVLHELWHHVMADLDHDKPYLVDGKKDWYADTEPEFWDTPFGEKYKTYYRKIFKKTHPRYKQAIGLRGPYGGAYDECFGWLWPEPDPATFNLNRHIN